MSSEVKWNISVGLLTSVLATTLVALVTHESRAWSLLGWLIALESLQLPVIAAAQRGRFDPCTAWLRRSLLERSGALFPRR